MAGFLGSVSNEVGEVVTNVTSAASMALPIFGLMIGVVLILKLVGKVAKKG